MLFFSSPTAWAQSGETLTYSAYDGTEELTSWGSNKKENYGVAIHLTDPNLSGMVIKAVRVPFDDHVDGLSGGAVFLTKTLSVASKLNVADISVDSFTVASGWVEVELAEPYTITESGVYVGYTFNEDELVEAPVVTIDKPGTEDFYVFSTRTYRKWDNLCASAGKSSPLQVILTNVPPNAASITFNEMDISLNNPKVPLTISNHGARGIQSIDYSYTLNGVGQSLHHDFTPSIASLFNKSVELDLVLHENTELGTQTLTVVIDKVNGEGNLDNSPTHTADIHVYPYLPVKRALLEEYTGTWCGYCPRGFVGLEHMHRLYPDDFICVSYHNNDPMEFTSNYPNSISGYPDAWLDRIHQTDAYSGDGSSYPQHFNLDVIWSARNKDKAPLGIDVTARYTDEEQTKIEVATLITSPVDMSDANKYRVSCILVANGLTKAGDNNHQSRWEQSNYYANNTDAWPDDDMKPFTEGGNYVGDLTYNFVMCGWSGRNGISGSIPANLTAAVPHEYKYNFDITKAVNSSGYPIYQDKEKMEVVAIILNASTGEVVNANKCKVLSDNLSGVFNTDAPKTVTPIRYYTIDGKPLNAPQKGITLVRMSDGSSLKKVK